MKRIVSIQDISCVGKCSQTIALPIISAMGIETSVIPTAVLSTHTMFPGFTFKDLSDQIAPITAHWKQQNIEFDAILSGYLGSIEQIDMISDFYRDFKKESTITVIDPVFADNGKLYPGFDDAYADAISRLCCEADYIVPNITEAAFMANMPYNTNYDDNYIGNILDILSDKGCKNIIITSIICDGKNGIVARLTDGSELECFRDNIDTNFHGTGDLFASTFTGALVNGFSTKDAIEIAIDYTTETLKATLADNAHSWYGVSFEKTIPYLLKRIGL